MLNNQKLKEFFYRLFRQCTDCKLSIMTLPDKQIRHYLPEQLDQLIADGQRLGAVCNALSSKITAVRVENDNTLVFCHAGGTETVKRWQDRSRRESWTPAMKELARQKELERRSHHDKQ